MVLRQIVLHLYSHPRLRSLFVLLAILGIFGSATEAKLSQYQPRGSSTSYVSKAVKMADRAVDPRDKMDAAAAAVSPAAPVALPGWPHDTHEFLPALDPVSQAPQFRAPPVRA